MSKIFISTTSFGKFDESPLELFKSKGFEIIFNPFGREVKPDELVELAKDVIGIVAGTEPITNDSLTKLPNLKVISRCGVGLDNIDMDAVNRLGTKVYNTPDTPTIAVAELTLGLILNLLRKINKMEDGVRNGKWEKLMGNLLSQKKVGIIGFGRIGQKVAELLIPFRCEIRFYDIRSVDEGLRTEWKGLRANFEELLKTSDIISIHVSSKEQIIGAREIGLMKKRAWLVNVSRGGVVDEESLYLALKNEYLSGAAIDVFKQEPYSGQLKELDNVILTPHIGSYAVESRIKMEMESAKNLLKGLGLPD